MVIRRRGALWPLVAFVAVLPVVLKAVPILPSNDGLPDEIRCLSGIHRVSLAFAPLPEDLRESGVSEDALRAIIEERLGQAQIDIEDDVAVKPRLIVSLRSERVSDLPDVRAIAITVELYQDVALLRFETDNRMTLPTTTFAGITAAHPHTVRVAVGQRFRALADSMVGVLSMVREEGASHGEE